ncbi:MAG TPA: hypothetical protein VFC00_26685 [Micromonosporaceae bacterium]|nr:hypothetical protein [Micromonosporaceae bacterium]
MCSPTGTAPDCSVACRRLPLSGPPEGTVRWHTHGLDAALAAAVEAAPRPRRYPSTVPATMPPADLNPLIWVRGTAVRQRTGKYLSKVGTQLAG